MQEFLAEKALGVILPLVKMLLGDVTKLSGAGTAFLIVGILRVHMKPIVSLAKSIASMTPSKKDDEAIAKIEQGKAGKIAAYLADWFLSLKKIK